jgi:hypothetical protein
MMKTGIDLIAEERAAQVSREGWTPEHDDEHTESEMAQAAVAYIEYAGQQDHGKRVAQHISDSIMSRHWPWDAAWWKPKDQLRNLVRAGALIAAEIDRLQRISPKKHIEEPKS